MRIPDENGEIDWSKPLPPIDPSTVTKLIATCRHCGERDEFDLNPPDVPSYA